MALSSQSARFTWCVLERITKGQLTNSPNPEAEGMAKSTCMHCLCLVTFLCGFEIVAAQELRKPAAYDFRESNSYRALDEASRAALETVVDDLEQLERALDAFMKDHDGAPPATLEGLVPRYIKNLPQDPFAGPAETIPDYLKHHQRSLGGRGYPYLRKPIGLSIKSYKPLRFEPSPGAWHIQSLGLRSFPLRYPISNPGLIRSRGYWGRMQFDIF